MAELISGLSLGLGLDTTGIDQGLKQLKGKLSLVSSEMKLNMSAFDRGEKSVDKYNTQLTGLNKKLDLQKAATSAAKTEYEKMVALHGEGSTQADKAAAAYNNQAATLNNLERYVGELTDEFKAFQKEQDIANSKFGKLSESMEKMGDKMSAVGDKMASVGKGLTMGITAPIVAFGAAGIMAFNEVDEAIDTVITKTGATGEAAEELTENFRTVAKRVPDDLLSVGEAIGEVNTQFGFLGKELEDNSQLMLQFASINGTDVTSASIASKQAIEAYGLANGDLGSVLDSVTKTAQDTGQAVDFLFDKATKGAPQIKALGLTFGEGTALIGSFEKAGVDSGAALSSMSKAQVIFAKDGKTLEEGLDGTIKSILGAKSETEALNIAAKVFGTKGGPRMVDAIKRGTFNLDDFAGAGDNAAGTVKDTFNETVDPIDQAAIAMNNAKLAMSEVGEVVQVALLPFMEKATEVLGKLADKFRGLSPEAKQTILVVAGIAAAVGPVLVAVGSMISMFGGVMTALAPVSLAIAKAGGIMKVLGIAFAAITGPVGITIGVIALLTAGFVIAYKKSETFRNFIHGLGDTFKAVFGKIKEFIQPGIDAVIGFFDGIKMKIGMFIHGEGAQLIQAFQNIGKLIALYVKGYLAVVKWVFGKILDVIKFIMPAVMFVIDMVWGNIKGVITGALDIIMGALKVFSGLFTGDFAKMWEGVKQMFSGAINAVWNYLQLMFIGRILKGIGGFVGLFGRLLGNMWAFAKGLFTKSVSTVFNITKSGFTFVLNIIKTILTGIRNVISSIWNGILSTIKSIVTNIWTLVKNIFTTMKNGVTTLVSGARTGIVNQWNLIKSSVTKLATGMWTAVKKTFTDMVDGAKKLPGRMGDGIKNASSKATDAIKNMGNKMLGSLEKPVNGMLKGVNWVTDKLGIKTKIPNVELPRYAKGTKGSGHAGGDFIAGEKGRELVKLPSGESFVTPNKATFYPNMPKGTHVIPNNATEDILKFDIPHFAEGTKGWFSKIGDVWDYVKNPSKIIDKVISGLGIGKVTGFRKDLAGAGWDFLKSKPVDYIKSMFGKSEEDGNAPGSGKPAFKWPVTSNFGYRMHPIHKTHKLHAGTDYGAPTGSPIPSTTGGKVSFAGRSGGFGNLVKVKNGIMEMFYAHMSKIMVSAGQSVKKGDILGLVGSTGNSTGPHLHYETHRNGKAINPMSIKGFANGGLVKKQQLAMVGEGNFEEIIIPTGDPRKRTNAMKLLALAGRKLGVDGGNGGSISPGSMPNGNGGKSEEISLLRRQVELLTQLVLSSQNIEAKPVLSEGDISRSYNKMDARQSSKHDIFTGKRG